MNKTALLIVDIQNDFCPGGALPVPDGDKIVPVVNMLIACAQGENWPIFASRDWHPQNHISFKEQGGQWPAHCLQSTKGAELHPDLKLPQNKFTLISKGTEQNKDSYSTFGGTDLEQQLRRHGITKLLICGLALDYCVKASALDAKKLEFEVIVFENATRAVNVSSNDGLYAKVEMWNNEIKIMNFPEFN